MADFVLRGAIAGISEIVSGLGDVDKGLSSTGTSANTSSKSLSDYAKIGLAAVGAAAAAAAGALGASATALVNLGGELNDMSQKTGVSVERLSELKFAASQSGVELGTLNTAFRTLSGNVVDAQKGVGKATEAFDDLGISVEDQNGILKTNDDLLYEIADKFKAMPDGAGKAEAATKLFGKAGTDLIPVLNAGSDGLKAMGEDAEKLGLRMSGETASASDTLGDNIDILTGAAIGFMNKAITPLIPLLTSLSTELLDGVKSSDSLSGSSEALTNIFKGMLLGVTVLKNTVDVLAGTFTAVAKAAYLAATGEFSKAWQALEDGGRGVIEDFNDVKKSVDNLFLDTSKTVKTTTGEIVKTSASANAEIEKDTKQTASDLDFAWAQYKKNVAINEDATRKEIEKGMELYKKNKEINDNAIVKQNEKNKEDLEKSWKLYYENLAVNDKAAMDEMKKASIEYTNAVNANNKAIEEQSKTVFENIFDAFSDGVNDTFVKQDEWSLVYKENIQEMHDFAGNTFRDVTQSFGTEIGNMIVKGEEFDMKDVFQGVAVQAIAMATTMSIQAGIMAAAGTLVSVSWSAFLIPIAAIVAAVIAAKLIFDEFGLVGVAVGAAISIAFFPVTAPFVAIGAAVIALIAIFKDCNSVGDFLAKALQLMFAPVTLLFGSLKDAVKFFKDGLQSLADFVKPLGAILAAPFAAMLVAINGALSALKGIGDALGGLASKAKGVFDDIGGGVKSAADKIGGGVKDILGIGGGKDMDAQQQELLKEWSRRGEGPFSAFKKAANREIPPGYTPTWESQWKTGGTVGPQYTLPNPYDPSGFQFAFATGGSFLTTGPRLFVAGENGPERITVSPSGSSASDTGGGRNYIFNGPVVMDYITAKRFTREQFTALGSERVRYA